MKSTSDEIGVQQILSAEKDNAEIGQISIYLAKADVKFDDTIDWANGIKQKPQYVDHSFEADGVQCRFLYFETQNQKKNPPWLDFVNVQLAPDEQIKFKASSRNANSILGLEIKNRTFVAAFGRSASSFLVRDNLESDFGIKSAMNLCGNEELRQIQTQGHSMVATLINRQVSRPSDSSTLGVGESEELKSISAHMKGDPKVTLQGRDHLTLKILGDEKISWEELIDRCKGFLKAYGKKDYVKLFPNYRNLQAASDEEVLKLDDFLLKAIKGEEFDELQLWVPEFIANDEFSFSYTDNEIHGNLIYAYIEPAQLKAHLDFGKLSIKTLKSRRIYAYSHEDDRIISSKRWPIYKCLICEHEIGKKHFVLVDGEWKFVDPDFYNSVLAFVKEHVKEESIEDVYKDISIADEATGKNSEGLFNIEVCKRSPRAILFDKAKLRIGTGTKDKEFCDILHLTEDGTMRIINCKQLSGSSSTSYLFTQTRVYCESFLRDQTFLDEIREHISSSQCPVKDEYLTHIKQIQKDVNGSDYRVCIWLLHTHHKTHTREGLPFIAQYELKLMYEELQHHFKFKEVVLRFIPVKMVNFVKEANP